MLAEHLSNLDERHRNSKAIPGEVRQNLTKFIDNIYHHDYWLSTRECDLVNISLIGTKEKSLICHIRLNKRQGPRFHWGKRQHYLSDGKVANLEFSLDKENSTIVKITF